MRGNRNRLLQPGKVLLLFLLITKSCGNQSNQMVTRVTTLGLRHITRISFSTEHMIHETSNSEQFRKGKSITQEFYNVLTGSRYFSRFWNHVFTVMQSEVGLGRNMWATDIWLIIHCIDEHIKPIHTNSRPKWIRCYRIHTHLNRLFSSFIVIEIFFEWLTLRQR